MNQVMRLLFIMACILFLPHIRSQQKLEDTQWAQEAHERHILENGGNLDYTDIEALRFDHRILEPLLTEHLNKSQSSGATRIKVAVLSRSLTISKPFTLNLLNILRFWRPPSEQTFTVAFLGGTSDDQALNGMCNITARFETRSLVLHQCTIRKGLRGKGPSREFEK